MPELPEVEVTRRGLAPRLVGRVISAVAVHEPRLRWPISQDVRGLAGRTVRSVRRRGKYLLVDCGDGHLILHLGMSGNPLLAHLGIEPLSRALDPARLHALAQPHRTSIKQFLMDARRIVGVGNIYANEALFRAGVHPRTPANRISLEKSRKLAVAIKHTLRAAIRAGGSSLRDFVGADGSPGDFQQRYWVYDRAGMPCRECGARIRRIVQGQRSTYFCPRCQR